MQQEGSHLQAKERGLWRNQSCPSLDLGLPASMTGGNRCCCLSHPVCGALLWQTNQPNPSGMGGVPSYLKLTGQLALNQPQGKLRRVKKKKLKRAMRKAKAASPGITPTRQPRQQLRPPRGWENNSPLDGEWHGLAPPDSPIRSGLGLVICATSRVFIKRT